MRRVQPLFLLPVNARFFFFLRVLLLLLLFLFFSDCLKGNKCSPLAGRWSGKSEQLKILSQKE